MIANYKCTVLLSLAVVLLLSLAACGSQPEPEPDETDTFYAQAGDQVWTHHYYKADYPSDIQYDTVITFQEDRQFFGLLYSLDSCDSYRFQGNYFANDGVLTFDYQFDYDPSNTITDSYQFSIVGSAMTLDPYSGSHFTAFDGDSPVSYVAYSDVFTPSSLRDNVLKNWGISYE